MKDLLTKTNLAILASFFVLGIVWFFVTLHNSRSSFPNAFVMDYSAFKPETISYELLGQPGSQAEGNSNSEAEVQVVIYRNIDLARVKESYPTLNGRYDYRFVEYREALDFLAQHIAELQKRKSDQNAERAKVAEQLISECEQTRAKIIEKLGT